MSSLRIVLLFFRDCKEAKKVRWAEVFLPAGGRAAGGEWEAGRKRNRTQSGAAGGVWCAAGLEVAEGFGQLGEGAGEVVG